MQLTAMVQKDGFQCLALMIFQASQEVIIMERGDLEAEGPVLIQLHMEEEEEEVSLVAVAANMHSIVAVVMAMEEMEEEEEDPLMEERTKIIKPVRMKATERSSSPILATNSHSCHCEGQKPMAIQCITVNG